MKGPGNSGGYTPEPFSLEQTPPGGADTQRVPGRAQRAGCSSPVFKPALLLRRGGPGWATRSKQLDFPQNRPGSLEGGAGA